MTFSTAPRPTGKQERNLRKWVDARLQAGGSAATVTAEVESRGLLFGADAKKYVDSIVKRRAEMEQFRLEFHKLYHAWFTDRLALSAVYIVVGLFFVILITGFLFDEA